MRRGPLADSACVVRAPAQQYANGDRFAGDWLNDVRHGKGKAFLAGPDGGEYDGDWMDDR